MHGTVSSSPSGRSCAGGSAGMRAAGLLGGWAADMALGDPRRFHPVAGFGRVAASLERSIYSSSRFRGGTYAALLVGGAAGAAALAARLAERLCGPAGRAVVLAAVTWGALGGRSLVREGERIAGHLERGDVDAARAALPALAGRDPAQLDAEGISRAVVESLAENSSDAVVGALVWGALGGPAGVAAFRAANTLDAIVGHRDERYERFGFASAKLDDAMGWPGARLGALLAVVLAPVVGGSPRAALHVLRRDGAAHPSPNAGRVEAAFAGALGLRLGGPLRYGARIEHRPELGDGRTPQPADIARAARLSLAVGAASALLCAAASSGSGRSGGPRRPGLAQAAR